MKFPLPRGSLELKFGKDVYSPLRTSIDTLVLADLLLPGLSVVDVGCGSGYLGLGLKKMHPDTEVTLVDKYPESVETTKKNAKLNKLSVEVRQGDLLEGIKADAIIANLPTYSQEQVKGPLYGPISAYLDPELDLYSRLFTQALTALPPGGYLIIECQSDQQWRLPELSQGFHLILRNDHGFAFIRPVVKKTER